MKYLIPIGDERKRRPDVKLPDALVFLFGHRFYGTELRQRYACSTATHYAGLPWIHDFPTSWLDSSRDQIYNYAIEEEYRLSPESYAFHEDTGKYLCWTDLVRLGYGHYEHHAPPATPGFWEIFFARRDNGLRNYGPARMRRLIGGMTRYAAATRDASLMETVRLIMKERKR